MLIMFPKAFFNTPVRSLGRGHGGDEVLARVARGLAVVEDPLDLQLDLWRGQQAVLAVAGHTIVLAPVRIVWSKWILHRKFVLCFIRFRDSPKYGSH